jgi:hypothetical protein
MTNAQNSKNLSDNKKIEVDSEYGKQLEKIFNGNFLGAGSKEKDHNNGDNETKVVKIIERGYRAPVCINKKSLMFIGLNPSFPKNKGRRGPDYPYFPVHETDMSLTPLDKKLWNDFFKPYAYFREIRKFAENVKMSENYSIVDLLFFRANEQDQVKEIMRNDNEFISKQLEISKSMIESSNPRIIIVCNAYARDLIKTEIYDNMRSLTDVNENTGTFEIINGQGRRVPVFFTSMLSGQRALDSGSRKHLEWHVRRVSQQLLQDE